MTAPPDWASVMRVLDAARCDLKAGQMIKAEQSSLLDLMGAIEIMDPRTDSYLLHQQSSVSSNLPPFDPTHEMTPRELIWVLDELLGLEMKFLDGFPLASTVFECQYLRPTALADLASTAAASPSVWTSILLEMLLSITHCIRMIWQELCKAQVYEHEDVHLGLGGLDFESLLQAGSNHVLATTEDGKADVTTKDIAHRLDIALANLLQVDFCDPTLCNAIATRLQLRIHLMSAYATLATPPRIGPYVVQHHLGCVAHFIPLAQHWNKNSHRATCFQPQPQLLAIFSSQFPLPSPHPPHCTAQFCSSEGWDQLGFLVANLLGSVQAWQQFLRTASWHDLVEWSSQGRAQQMLVQPYARSVWQVGGIHVSIIWSDGACMGSLTPLSLVSSFLFAMTGLDPMIWQQLLDLRTVEETWDAPARKILGWAHQLGLQLIRTLQIAAQNPSRQRRLLVKEFQAWPILIAKTLSTINLLATVLRPPASLALAPTALSVVALEQALQVLLQGQNLALLTSVECQQTGWVILEVATLLVNQLGGLQHTNVHMSQGGLGLLWLLNAHKAQKMGQDMLLGSGSRHIIEGGYTAFLPQCESLSTTHNRLYHRLKFTQRFGWLQGCLVEGGVSLDQLCSYAAYNAEQCLCASKS
ncbi:BZ3500_MvSof-1268-A1-R1_Chr8-2g10057 [Microbotryum saponariae]|uniref:BZ3500_MvSof-1268-A1-R1_Chr8-2g10057 protein n=1 Tax=Microbotryum saponariae TaxID=289078 RepID=A0A2X0LBC4_9BASI|nr:BZ3500_MvSof-1268-A1-R1_Chr8-2g10057 [Microbotryum saponariae]SDA01694.1 BZ3501_MvSof-1269-A2-R1_Chr8-2g09807 [Microbotryum saponariae]